MYKGKSISAILLAAGTSSRMGKNKMQLKFNGHTPIELCAAAFSAISDEVIVTYSVDTKEAAIDARSKCALPVKLVLGGNCRQISVKNALKEASKDIVAIHDCARCLITADVILRSLDLAIEYGCGIASVPVVDTIRNIETGEIIDRSTLSAAQTPQSFQRLKLIDAYEHINDIYTDDAALYRDYGEKLHYSMGSRNNLKLTTPDDIPLFDALISQRNL